jgi:hypothetical protein
MSGELRHEQAPVRIMRSNSKSRVWFWLPWLKVLNTSTFLKSRFELTSVPLKTSLSVIKSHS